MQSREKKKKITVVFMWAGFGNALHAYILMVFGLFFLAQLQMQKVMAWDPEDSERIKGQTCHCVT